MHDNSISCRPQLGANQRNGDNVDANAAPLIAFTRTAWSFRVRRPLNVVRREIEESFRTPNSAFSATHVSKLSGDASHFRLHFHSRQRDSRRVRPLRPDPK